MLVPYMVVPTRFYTYSVDPKRTEAHRSVCVNPYTLNFIPYTLNSEPLYLKPHTLHPTL